MDFQLCSGPCAEPYRENEDGISGRRYTGHAAPILKEFLISELDKTSTKIIIESYFTADKSNRRFKS